MTDLLDQNNQTEMVDQTKDYLKELVGEGKKFKSPEDLARGKYEADLTVQSRNKELSQLRDDYLKLREEYNAKAKLEELVAQLSDPERRQQRTSSDNDQRANDTVNQPQIDLKQIDVLVTNKLQEHETTRRQTENAELVRSKLIEKLGPNYQASVEKQLSDLDLSRDAFNLLAKTNPKLVFKTLGLDASNQTEDFQAPMETTGRFAPRVQKRTWSYYQDIKQKDPKGYSSPKIQSQMMEDASRLGKDFEDGDYHKYGF